MYFIFTLYFHLNYLISFITYHPSLKCQNTILVIVIYSNILCVLFQFLFFYFNHLTPDSTSPHTLHPTHFNPHTSTHTRSPLIYKQICRKQIVYFRYFRYLSILGNFWGDVTCNVGINSKEAFNSINVAPNAIKTEITLLK